MTTHEITLTGYKAEYKEGILYLGTKESYGNERLHLTLGEDWKGLTITATFTNHGSTEVIMTADGMVTVPPEATAMNTSYIRRGWLVIKGSADGVRRISVDLEFVVENHAPISGDNSIDPTPDQYTQFVNEVRDAASGASPGQIEAAVNAYLEKNPIESVTVDTTLRKAGMAADAKAVGDTIAQIELTPGPQGPKGDPGDTGPQGPQGPRGEKGEPGSSVSIPVFDLAAEGLATVPMDGTAVYLQKDFSALCSALESAPVHVILTISDGKVESTVSCILSAISMDGQYMCAYTVDFMGSAFMLNIGVSIGGLSAKITPYTTYIGAYIDEALGGDY